MPTKIDPFYRAVPGRIYELQDITQKIADSGDWKQIAGMDVLVTHLLNLLNIGRATYLMDPEFGLGLYRYLFEPVDATTQRAIEAEVAHAISQVTTSASISYEVGFFTDRKGFRIDITIDYQGKKKDLSVNITDSVLREAV